MEELRVQIEQVRQHLLMMTSQKRVLIDETYGLEHELDKTREEIHGISEKYWIEMLRLDRLERTLRGMLEEK